jgi:hypothetical protein
VANAVEAADVETAGGADEAIIGIETLIVEAEEGLIDELHVIRGRHPLVDAIPGSEIHSELPESLILMFPEAEVVEGRTTVAAEDYLYLNHHQPRRLVQNQALRLGDDAAHPQDLVHQHLADVDQYRQIEGGMHTGVEEVSEEQEVQIVDLVEEVLHPQMPRSPAPHDLRREGDRPLYQLVPLLHLGHADPAVDVTLVLDLDLLRRLAPLHHAGRKEQRLLQMISQRRELALVGAVNVTNVG